MKVYFISDVHLKNEKDPRCGILLRFLESVRDESHGGETVKLVLLGDIFDLWIGGSSAFRLRYQSVVAAIEKCAQAGVQIDIFEGNHDLHLEMAWRNVAGVQVHSEHRTFRVGSSVVRAEHGDLMNPADYGYKALRWFLRTSPLTFAARHLSGQIIQSVGDQLSQQSSRMNQVRSESDLSRIRGFMRAYTEREAKKESFDVLVTGHTHVFDEWDFEWSGRKIRFFNLGCWADKPRVLVMSDSREGGASTDRNGSWPSTEIVELT